jgi:hypothetical protein
VLTETKVFRVSKVLLEMQEPMALTVLMAIKAYKAYKAL